MPTSAEESIQKDMLVIANPHVILQRVDMGEMGFTVMKLSIKF